MKIPASVVALGAESAFEAKWITGSAIERLWVLIVVDVPVTTRLCVVRVPVVVRLLPTKDMEPEADVICPSLKLIFASVCP